MASVNDSDLGWLAGAYDFDGCITPIVGKNDYVKKDGSRGILFRVEVAFINTHLPSVKVVEEMLTTLGVKHSTQMVAPSGLSRLPLWKVRTNGQRSAVTLLTAILPYMRTKRERAETVLAIVERRRTQRKTGWGKPVLDADNQWLKDQIESMRINKR